MAEKFDPHAAIKRLAEAEWECPGSVHATNPPPSPLAGASFCVGSDGRIYPSCDGTGRISPFKALRVPCPCLGLLQYGSDGINHWYDRGGCKECYLRLKHIACLACAGRGWVPESDIERACWRVFWQLRPDIRSRLAYGVYGVYESETYSEAVLRAAESRLVERKTW